MSNFNSSAFGTPINYATDITTSSNNDLLILFGVLLTITVVVIVVKTNKNAELERKITILRNEKTSTANS